MQFIVKIETGNEAMSDGRLGAIPMSGDILPAPGWHPPPSANAAEGDCMRRAVACVMGVHPDDVPWIPPRQPGGIVQFIRLYREACAELGFELSEFVREQFPNRIQPWGWLRFRDVDIQTGLWIGVCPAGRNSHAIVFDGMRMHFGGQHRKRTPTKLGLGFTLTPCL